MAIPRTAGGIIVPSGGGVVGIGRANSAVPQTRLSVQFQTTNAGVTGIINVPIGSTVEIVAPNGRKFTYDETGQQSFSQPWTALTGESDFDYVTLAIGVSGGGKRFYRLDYTDGDENPDPDPVFGNVTAPVMTTTGDVGAALSYTDATWTGVATAAYTLETSAAGVAPFTDRGAVPTTVPSYAGSHVNIKAVVTPTGGGSAVTVRSNTKLVTTPAQTIPDAPVLDTDFEIADSVYKAAGNVTDFRARVDFAEILATYPSAQFEWNSSPTTEVDPPFRRMTLVSGTTSVFEAKNDYDGATRDPAVDVATDYAQWTAADETRRERMRVRYRQTSTGLWSPPSARFEVPVPPSATETPDITVDTAAELIAAVKASTTTLGVTTYTYNVIAVAKATYAGVLNFGLVDRGFDKPAKIIPVNRADPATFTGAWNFNSGSSGIWIDGFLVVSSGISADVYSQAEHGNDVFAGGWPDDKWIDANNVNGLTIRNCLIEGHHIGIDVSATGTRGSSYSTTTKKGQTAVTRNVVIEYNDFRQQGMDTVRAFDNCSIIFRNNDYRNPKQDYERAENSDRHADVVQFACGRTAYGAENCLIENNYMKLNDGYHHCLLLLNARCARKGGASDSQGGYATERGETADARGDKSIYGHRNMVVRGNYIESRHEHAIACAGVHNVLIEGNLLRQAADDPNLPVAPVTAGELANEQDDDPRIGLAGVNSGIIRNNVSPEGIFTYQSGSGVTRGPLGSAADMTVTDFVTSSTAVPTGWTTPVAGRYAYNGGVPAP